MSLKPRILEDVKIAMKSGDKRRLGVLRLVTAALKQKEVDERIELDDSHVIAILDKMLKQRRESVTQYEKAGRDELAEQETYEIGVIQEYLPKPFTEDEIRDLIKTAIDDTGALGIKDMGKVMGKLKPRLAGRADMSKVSAQVRAALG